jgi:TolB protein
VSSFRALQANAAVVGLALAVSGCGAVTNAIPPASPSQEASGDRASPSPGASPSASGGGTILFVRVHDGQSTFFRIDPDGSHLLPLSRPSNGGSETPTWTRDGRVLYDSNSQIFILDPLSGRIVQVTTDGNVHTAPALSPDGTTLAFEESSSHDDTIHLASVDGSHDRYLTKSGRGILSDTGPAFSPDGRFVAFERVTDDTPNAVKAAIFVIGVDGAGLRQLTPFDMDAGYPRWSPDGSRILFTENRDADLANGPPVSLNLWTVRPDGTGLTQLTHEHDRFAMDAAWSPDGASIVYRSWHGADDFMAIRRMDADGSDPAVVWKLMFGDGTLETPDWRAGA